MNSYTPVRAMRGARSVLSSTRSINRCQRNIHNSTQSLPSQSSKSNSRTAAIVASAIGVTAISVAALSSTIYAEVVPAPAEVQFEKKRKKPKNREDNRDLISSQHLQVKRSWENPGVYAWGSNAGRVVAPDSDDNSIKTPRRLTYFDNMLLRDIKLDRNFGAAVTENGDVLQWGAGYAADCRTPVATLRGKDIVKISISRDRVLALSKAGKVYTLSVAKADQESGPKPSESSWIPFYSTTSPISYREMNIDNLAWGENISDMSSGLEHCLLLTSKGRLFSAASGTEDFPARGQLGVPGLTWTTRPPGPYDQPHEINTLKGFNIKKIAAGDYHSLALDDQGRVFSWGDNSLGQLAFEVSSDVPSIDAPSLIPISKLYSKTNLSPKVTNIAAGGVNSFFAVDATLVAGQGSDETNSRLLGRVTADLWACGQGIWGGLGNGRWTHVQGSPTKVSALSGLFEYDEVKNVTIPIRLAHLSVGSTHAAATMKNVTHVGATSESSHNDTNWGADVLWWGNNEHYQLGTGRRNNVSNPIYIAPMDLAADRAKGRREEHRFQITPRHKVKFAGRNVEMEQKIECGRNVTCVYSAT